MSVSTNQNADTSTDNANWGTLVVLLVLAFVAVTIGVILYNDSQKPAVPMSVSSPASTAAAPAAPTGANGASTPSAGKPAGGSPAGGGQ